MKKIERHIYFKQDVFNKLDDYCKDKKLNISEGVCELVENAHELYILNSKIDKLENDMKYLIRKTIIQYKLLEQLYSDLGFTNLSDISRSDTLKEFNNLLKRGKMID